MLKIEDIKFICSTAEGDAFMTKDCKLYCPYSSSCAALHLAERYLYAIKGIEFRKAIKIPKYPEPEVIKSTTALELFFGARLVMWLKQKGVIKK